MGLMPHGDGAERSTALSPLCFAALEAKLKPVERVLPTDQPLLSQAPRGTDVQQGSDCC